MEDGRITEINSEEEFKDIIQKELDIFSADPNLLPGWNLSDNSIIEEAEPFELVLLSKYGTIINNDTREILLSPEQLLQKYSFNTEECRGWRDKQYKYVGKYRMRGSAYKVDLNVYKAIGVSTKLETGV